MNSEQRVEEKITDTKSANEKIIPQRGALQVTIEPSAPIISAGSNFSIAVTIRNPFDIPLTIGSVSTLLPVDLYDLVLVARLKEKQKLEQHIRSSRHTLLSQLSEVVISKTWTPEGRVRRFLRVILSLIPFTPVDIVTDVASMAFAQAAEIDWKKPELNQAISTVAKLFEEPKLITEQAMSKEEIKARADLIITSLQEEYKQLETEIQQSSLLQPGDSITKAFTLRTKRGITFRPNSYKLNILVSYQADAVPHFQSIPYSIDIQSSLNAVILGAAIGSLFGFLASKPDIFDWRLNIVIPEVISVLVLSSFAVIAFARKEGVQPIIAVQDFWGGLLIGFLVGYSGLQALGSVFGAVNNGSTPTPAPTP